MEVPLFTDYIYYENNHKYLGKFIFAVHKENKRVWTFWDHPAHWHKEAWWYNEKSLEKVKTYSLLSPLEALVRIGFCPGSGKDIERHIEFIDNQIKVSGRAQEVLHNLLAERDKLKEQLAEIYRE